MATKSKKVNLAIEQGATFRKPVWWKAGNPLAPVDLTGWTARAQFRAEIDSTVVLLELTTENGGITITPLEGKVEFYLSAIETADIDWETAVYDLELVQSPEEVKRLCSGSITVSKEVTRD